MKHSVKEKTFDIHMLIYDEKTLYLRKSTSAYIIFSQGELKLGSLYPLMYILKYVDLWLRSKKVPGPLWNGFVRNEGAGGDLPHAVLLHKRTNNTRLCCSSIL